MPWLLLLHIIFLVGWCGSLLYLPALIHGSVNQAFPDGAGSMVGRQPRMPRWVFTLVSTPAALLAIVAGTGVFLANAIVEFWLLAKLALVSVLVVGHILMGVLITRAEQGKHRLLTRWCLVSAIALSALMVSIIWIVLSKPLQEA